MRNACVEFRQRLYIKHTRRSAKRFNVSAVAIVYVHNECNFVIISGFHKAIPRDCKRTGCSVISGAVIIPGLINRPVFLVRTLAQSQGCIYCTVSTIVSFSKGNSFTSVPFTGTGKLKIIFLIQLPSGCFSGNNSIRSINARMNSFRSTSEAAS